MSVIKFNRNFSDLFNWDTSEQPTTEQEYQNAVKNWTQTEMNLVDTVLWQPETAYSVGNIAKTPSLPSQYILVCTEAGDSGVAEPDYTGVSVGDTVVDGTVTWLVSTIANGGNIDTLTTAVEANTQAIGEHSTAIAENTANVATNTADIATNAENIATNASDIANNTTDIEIADKRISNIEKLLQGNLYDYQTDSDSKYVKTVPAGAMPWASLDSVGGRTLVWNQIFDLSMLRGNTTSYGVTSEKTDNGIRLYGAFTSGVNLPVINSWYGAVIGHKYLITNTPISEALTLRLTQNGTYVDWQENTPFTATDTHTYLAIKPLTLNVNFDVTWTPQIFDLTLMFGAGNEPSTYEEFQQMFPADYYSYNAGTLLSAGVTEVVSKKADTTTIATYSIPAEIRNLEGYGWSAGNAYNYIDYERKVFVKNVDRVDLGTLGYSASSTSGHKYFFSGGLSDVIKYVVSSNAAVNNIVCDKYIAGSFLDAYNGTFDCIGVGGNLVNTGRIAIYDSTKEEMTTAEFKTSVSGIYAYYELATPQEIDISAYLTDDNLIEVESGGTLTFPNSNGDDYRIDVPSSETYMVDLQSALGD